ncbi:MAG: helix-turn-helix domain-containing protein [Acutalibacteraceae bacterium]|nr:helix-turn-helix domain-containing protein [Acutalibacteraceae bacterium]
MTLGEKIYELRTQHNLSQGDLANELNVSRQSISKWENGNSTPDLDKLTKLGKIFNISLDELVNNEETEKNIITTPEQIITTQTKTREKKIGKGLLIAGVISIFVFLLLGLGITGFFIAIPLFACSIIYYKAKSNHFLYCLWAIIPLADLYIRFAMGISWSVIKQTLEWEYSWNYGRLAIGWGQFIFILFLIIFSIVKLSKKNVEINKKFKSNFIAAVIGFAFLLAGEYLTSPLIMEKAINYTHLEIQQAIFTVMNIVFSIFDWLRIYLFVDFVTKAVQYIKEKKCLTD